MVGGRMCRGMLRCTSPSGLINDVGMHNLLKSSAKPCCETEAVHSPKQLVQEVHNLQVADGGGGASLHCQNGFI
jgi:hypothetical protein